MVHIDNMNARYRHMIMCHMIADTKEELLDMARKIGVNIKWIQDEDTPYEHFDICLNKKAIALSLGAKAITLRELGQIIIKRKECLKNLK